VLAGALVALRTAASSETRSAKPVMRGKRSIYLPLRKKFQPVPVYDRYSLKPGTKIAGPLILEERESTLVVPVAAGVKILPDFTVEVMIKEFE